MSARHPVALLLASGLAAGAPVPRAQGRLGGTSGVGCENLRDDAAAGVESAAVQPAKPGYPALPAHCEILGRLDVRTGEDGRPYAIRYHLRLPARWNGRFFFQGGSGTNGEIGDATGRLGGGAPSALAQGYAVVSQDSGHDNAINIDHEAGGTAAFGVDPVARANYGHASLVRVTYIARRLVTRYYGRPIVRSYFVGCSKGGQEGMALAQRYPWLFDGIMAAAPGFSLPKAALAQAWDVQTFGRLASAPNGALDISRLPSALSPAQSAAVGSAVVRACDRLDGLADGIVGAFAQCSWQRVAPELRKAQCSADGRGDSCLSAAQVAAVRRSLGGPQDGKGRAIYATWPLDAGIGSAGWRLWKLGSPKLPALNVLTGGAALSTIFTVPPTPVRDDPQSLADYLLAFDFVRGPRSIFATGAHYPRSAWTDIAARSADLDRFRARGGKMIVPQGVSDPVFSINDTLAWYAEVQRRHHGTADHFVRVFPVPGMNHCAGGPATSQFDPLAPLVRWVEQGRAPERIAASAASDTPWPGRTRPLCPYPKIASYVGAGSIETAVNFACRPPRRVAQPR